MATLTKPCLWELLYTKSVLVHCSKCLQLSAETLETLLHTGQNLACGAQFHSPTPSPLQCCFNAWSSPKHCPTTLKGGGGYLRELAAFRTVG